MRTTVLLPLLLTIPPALGIRAQEAPELTLDRTPMYGIGGAAAQGPFAFGSVDGLGFDDSGDLYILDAGARHVLRVDPRGELIETIGGAGQGPGELAVPTDLTVFPDGSLAVVDFGRRGLVVFGPDHRERAVVRLADAALNMRRAAARGGDLVLWETVESALLARSPRTRLVRGRADDPSTWRVVHEVPIPDLAGPAGEVSSDLWAGGIGPVVSFALGLRVAVLPDGGLAVADGSDYEIRVLAPDGVERTRIRRSAESRRVTRAMREARQEEEIALLESATAGASMQLDDGRSVPASGYARQVHRQRLEAMRFGPRVPVIRALASDAEGRLWVARDAVEGEGSPVDLLTQEGELLGRIVDLPRLPSAFGPDGLIARVEVDELDVARIVVERVQVRPAG